MRRPSDHPGKWVAVRDEIVLAHSLHRRSIITWLRLHPHPGAEVRRIPDPGRGCDGDLSVLTDRELREVADLEMKAHGNVSVRVFDALGERELPRMDLTEDVQRMIDTMTDPHNGIPLSTDRPRWWRRMWDWSGWR